MQAKNLVCSWPSVRAEELASVAQEIWALLKTYSFVAVIGEMGAGKTTTIAALVQASEITHFEGSPTFAIVQAYLSPTKAKIYHLDCYRIENETELINLGLEELFDETAYFFVEWPEKIKQILPFPHYWLYIRTNPDQSRTLELYHDN
ncbi:MAG: tRNA (adenosine(37)-N6)-threonylcarbamoyltransferase complex ATPase subunit type 1 TsaE [Flavobacteriales bacterium]